MTNERDTHHKRIQSYLTKNIGMDVMLSHVQSQRYSCDHSDGQAVIVMVISRTFSLTNSQGRRGGAIFKNVIVVIGLCLIPSQDRMSRVPQISAEKKGKETNQVLQILKGTWGSACAPDPQWK